MHSNNHLNYYCCAFLLVQSPLFEAKISFITKQGLLVKQICQFFYKINHIKSSIDLITGRIWRTLYQKKRYFF